MGRRAWASSAAALGTSAAVALLAAGAGAVPGVTTAGLDFGNAPDGTPTGYGPVGRFPSLRRSNGARADVGRALRLGVRLDAEADAKLAPAELDNDGVFLETYQPCNRAVLSVAVTLGRPAPAGGQAVYLNLWADWDRDGRWQGSDRCQSEHPVRDVRLVVPGGTRVAVFRLSFRAGAKPPPLWTRAVLSEAPLRRSVPTGRVGDGEVEDGTLSPLPDLVDCLWDILPHGGKGFAPLGVDPGLLPLERTVVEAQSLPRWSAKRTYPGPDPPATIAFRSLPADVDTIGGKPYLEFWTASGQVEPRRGKPVGFVCGFLVFHGAPVVGVPVGPPPSGPGPGGGGGGAPVVDTGIAVKGSWYVGSVTGRAGGGTGAIEFRVSEDGRRIEDLRFNTSYTCEQGVTSDLFDLGETAFSLATKTAPIPGRKNAVQRYQEARASIRATVVKATPRGTAVSAGIGLSLVFRNQGRGFKGFLQLKFADPNLGTCDTGTTTIEGSAAAKPVFPR